MVGIGAPPLGFGAPPLSQAAPLQQGRRALHWRRLASLRHFHGAVSRRDHNQLSALKPLFGVACPLWWNKEVDARQNLHGLPPMIGSCVSDQNHILGSSRPSHGMSRVGRGGQAPRLNLAVTLELERLHFPQPRMMAHCMASLVAPSKVMPLITVRMTSQQSEDLSMKSTLRSSAQ